MRPAAVQRTRLWRAATLTGLRRRDLVSVASFQGPTTPSPPSLASHTAAFKPTPALLNKCGVTGDSIVQPGIYHLVTESGAAGDVANVDIRTVFADSVKARTVGNNMLRRFIRSVPSSHWQRATEALEGAKDGGLVPDPDTMEAYLTLLLRSGQLRLALTTYNDMLQDRICPHTKTFNQLIELCIEKTSPDAAQSLFDEMLRRGRHPDIRTYELMIQGHALHRPARWEQAVVLFDRIQRSKVPMSSHTYNAIMKVYLNMEPFDYRVVYNAYFEMRCTKPRIHFGWDTYHLVAEALRRGNASRYLRFITWLDAWIQITPLFSGQYWAGAFVFVAFMTFLRVAMMQTAKMVRSVAEPPSQTPLTLPGAMRTTVSE